MKRLLSLYTWRFPMTLVALLQHHNYRMRPFWRQFWATSDFSTMAQAMPLRPSFSARVLVTLLYGVTTVFYFTGLYTIWYATQYDYLRGLWAYGLALIIAIPLILAVLIAIPVWLSYVGRPRYTARRCIARILELQVRQLRAKHHFTLIGVVGSVGKTTTKAAIAKTLGTSRKVLWQEGNYNVDVTVPLVLFSQPLPNLFNVVAWLKIWHQNAQTIRRPYPYDAVVIELGTDGPGQMEQFAYLNLDIAVITAIAPEHMEYFGTMDAVAQEELSVLAYAQQVLINIDDVDSAYLEGKRYLSYGLSAAADYRAQIDTDLAYKGQDIRFYKKSRQLVSARVAIPGLPGAKAALAALAVSDILGETAAAMQTGMAAIVPFAGRQRVFSGIKQSTLIDDTYNASPIAVKAALDVLYSAQSPQKIAILGSMNELGDFTAEAHREVGVYCRADELAMVITIGHDAERYLAPQARKQGCEVHCFDSPYAAGNFVKKRLKKSAVVLAKGSQNRVFAEEALKLLLANQADAADMVRQSNGWLAIKREQFSDFQ
jgi:UDP-N-acetylmuramoyl-tripeptide--D-alanyl-D-alanine ligase